MSLLVDHGHRQANRYPLPMVAAETQLVVTRLNQRTVTESLMFRRAITSVLSKEGGKDFDEAVKELNGE